MYSGILCTPWVGDRSTKREEDGQYDSHAASTIQASVLRKSLYRRDYPAQNRHVPVPQRFRHPNFISDVQLNWSSGAVGCKCYTQSNRRIS